MTMSNPITGEQTAQARTTFRLALILFVVTTVLLVLSVREDLGEQRTPLTLNNVLIVIPILSTVAGLWLSRTGRHHWGAIGMCAAIVVGCLGTIFIVADLGLVLGVSLALAIVFISFITLSGRLARWMIGFGVVAGVTAIGLDWMWPFPRPASGIADFLPYIFGGLLLAFGFLVFRQLPYFKIRNKLASGFGLQLALAGVVAAAGLIGLNGVQTSFQSAIEHGLKVERLAGEMKAELAEARRAERDFLLRWQPEGIENAYVNYVVAHQKHVARIHEIIIELEATERSGNLEGTNQRIRDDLVSLKPYVNVYAEDFQGIVLLIDQHGFKDSGLEGKFREAARQLEDRVFNQAGLEPLEETLLEIRRYEENYGVGGDPQDVTNIRNLTKTLKEQIAALEGLTAADKAALTKLTSDYVAAFDHLVILDTQLTAKIQAVRTAADVVEPLVADIAQSGQQAASTEIAAAQLAAGQTAFSVSITLAVAILSGLGLAYVLARQITTPLQGLVRTAGDISAGDLTAQAKVMTRDEIGTLALAFNGMTTQLRETLEGLEQRIADRTRDLALAAEVGQSLSTVRDLDSLLASAVEIIRARFDLYYTQIYLVDPAGRSLIMQAGTGDVGAELKRRGFTLPINSSSINGTAAADKRPMIVADTSASSTFRPNALLPETRSEMAVPLIVAGRVVGVLDVQSVKPGALDTDVLPAFQTLAGQLAIAIENAQLFDQAEVARAEVEAQARRLTRSGWQEFLDAVNRQERIGVTYDVKADSVLPRMFLDSETDADEAVLTQPIVVAGAPVGALRLEADDHQVWSEDDADLVAAVARQVAQQVENLRLLAQAEQYQAEAEQAIRRLTREGWDDYRESKSEAKLGYVYAEDQVAPAADDFVPGAASVRHAIAVRGEPIGVIEVSQAEEQADNADTLVSAIAERLSTHLENLRLTEQTEASLAETQSLYDVTTRLSATTTLHGVLEAIASTLKALGASGSSLMLFDLDAAGQPEWADIAAVWERSGQAADLPVGTRLHLPQYPLSRLLVRDISNPLLVSDVRWDEQVDRGASAVLQQAQALAIAVLPLTVNERWLGAAMVRWTAPRAFDESDRKFFKLLTAQMSVSVNSRVLFQETQTRADREAVINAINQKIQAATSVEGAIQTAAREIGQMLKARRAMVEIGQAETTPTWPGNGQPDSAPNGATHRA